MRSTFYIMDISSCEPQLEKLSLKLGYTFKQKELLTQALLHSSYVNENPDLELKDNERLEFLGDAVLELAISHLLMDLYEDAEEGNLSKYRSMIVDETGLYKVSLYLRLGDYLFLGKGEEHNQGRKKPSLLANTLEAIIGAIYLDAGYPTAINIIQKLFSQLLKNVPSKEMIHDFKSLYQEYTQQVFKALPKYQLVEESGPAHERTFRVILTMKNKIISEGRGKSKKEAEQMAAKEAFLA